MSHQGEEVVLEAEPVHGLQAEVPDARQQTRQHGRAVLDAIEAHSAGVDLSAIQGSRDTTGSNYNISTSQTRRSDLPSFKDGETSRSREDEQPRPYKVSHSKMCSSEPETFCTDVLPLSL